jgi:hypothetical protein
LGEIFVRSTNDYLFDARIAGGRGGCGSERIVGFILNHRPNDDASGRKDFLEQGELRQQRRLNAFSSLVARPKLIAKRFNHMIGCDCDVCGSILNHG